MLIKGPSGLQLEEGRSHKGAELNSGLILVGKCRHPLGEDTILREGIALIRMATSQATEMQIEGEVDMDKAVKEILPEVEVEEQDPIEGMLNAQVAEIYHRMKSEDQRLFRQF